MIIVKLVGGLGNQMFQYAFGKALAYYNKTALKLDIKHLLERDAPTFQTYRSYQLSVFNIDANIASQQEVDNMIKASITFLNKILYKVKPEIMPSKLLTETGFTFNSSALILKENIYVDGYWQSELYFKNIESIIRREFIFKSAPDIRSQSIINLIRSVEAVSIHIRRGDYINDKKTNQFHGICSLIYYKDAIAYFTKRIKKLHFFIFSDDPKWARENIITGYPTTYVEHNSSDKGYEDMRLMSQCQHNIIANSSFSWWAAWLNANPEKIVIAPLKWFNDPTINTQDLIPADWVRI